MQSGFLKLCFVFLKTALINSSFHWFYCKLIKAFLRKQIHMRSAGEMFPQKEKMQTATRFLLCSSTIWSTESDDIFALEWKWLPSFFLNKFFFCDNAELHNFIWINLKPSVGGNSGIKWNIFWLLKVLASLPLLHDNKGGKETQICVPRVCAPIAMAGRCSRVLPQQNWNCNDSPPVSKEGLPRRPHLDSRRPLGHLASKALGLGAWELEQRSSW